MSRAVKGEKHGVFGAQLSWAGECPWTTELCYGCEDGRFLVPPTELKATGDAINGIAFVGDNVGITSRSEVLIGYRKDSSNTSFGVYKHTFYGGAHGIVGSSQNAFLAPIGIDGLLNVNLLAGGGIGIWIVRHQGLPLNFYRLARLGESPVGEVFACASRQDGLFAIRLVDGSVVGPLIGHPFAGHDIIDVCPLHDPQFPLAALCLTRSRGIIFVRNVLENQASSPLFVDDLKGTAYSLVSAQGHVILLTDEQFVVLPNLATRFLQTEGFTGGIEIITTSSDASEIFLRDENSVLLLEDSLVLEYEFSELLNNETNSDASFSRGHADFILTADASSSVSHARYLPLDAEWGRIIELDLVASPTA